MGKKTETCWNCYGDGEVRFMLFFKRDCPVCGGKGKVKKPEKLNYTPISKIKTGIPHKSYASIPTATLKSRQDIEDEKKRKHDIYAASIITQRRNSLSNPMNPNSPLNINNPHNPISPRNPHNSSFNRHRTGGNTHRHTANPSHPRNMHKR